MGTEGRLNGPNRRPVRPASRRVAAVPGPADRALLADGLSRLGLDAADAQLTRYLIYLGELSLWSRRTDLVKFADIGELVVRHLLDSLAAVPTILGLCEDDLPAIERCRLCDVGSGAGFPGVPLALNLPLAEVVLLERSAKRASFLKTVCALSARTGMRALEQDLDTVTDSFDLVTARALSPFDDAVIRALADRVVPHGALLVYQGRQEYATETGQRLSQHFQRVDAVVLNVPFLDAERRLLIARKR